MAERSAQRRQQRHELRRVVGYSVADEITKLDQLKKSGSITDDEFDSLWPKSSSGGIAHQRGNVANDPKRTWEATPNRAAHVWLV